MSLEKRRLCIICFDRIPTLNPPFVIADFSFGDFLVKTFLKYRDGYPLKSQGSFYLVSVTPVIFSVLNFVINNKLIDHSDNIKVALPGYIVGLQNGHFLSRWFHARKIRYKIGSNSFSVNGGHLPGI